MLLHYLSLGDRPVFWLFGQVSKNPHKQASLGECGGVAVLLEVCAPKHKTEARLLVPVLWGLRNCLNDNAANKDRFVRAGGLEALVQVTGSSVMKDATNILQRPPHIVS